MAPGKMPYGFSVVSMGYLAGVRMLRRCAEPGCSTLGLGRMCIKHEPKLTRAFVRGRPWPPAVSVAKQTQVLAPVAQPAPR